MKIGDVVPYFDSNGNEKAAVITSLHQDGAVDLCVLTTNTRRAPARTWKEPGCCMVMPEVNTEPPTVTPVPAEGEMTATDQAEEHPHKRPHHKKHEK